MNRHKSFGTYRKVNIKQLLTSFCLLLLTMSMLIGCFRSEEKDKATLTYSSICRMDHVSNTD